MRYDSPKNRVDWKDIRGGMKSLLIILLSVLAGFSPFILCERRAVCGHKEIR
jgi:hypothetical protein